MIKQKQNLIVYKASAGSGKTFKLVSEYLKLCFSATTPFKFRKILAITFTNKAAGEMKERIIEHLRSLSSENNSKHYSQKLIDHYKNETGLAENILKEKAATILTSILHDYSSFSISTIDKFTHKIIRSFARDLKLSADFELEMDADFVLDKTVDEVISLAGTEEEITDILTRYINFLLNEEDSWKLEQNLKTFSKELLKEGTEEHLNLLHKISPEEFKKIINDITDYCNQEESQLLNIQNDFSEICMQNNILESDFHYTNTGLYKLILLIKKRAFEDLDLGSRIMTAFNDETLFSKKSKPKFDSSIEQELFSLLLQVKNWIIENKPKYIAHRLLHKNLYNLSLINKLSDKFKQVNREDNVVLISEFNRIISDVIKNDPAPFIYERIGERYHHILIDEFQDTSELQFANLIPLIENSLGNGNPCLLVGDPKQAIYRWRGGDVDQFIRLPELNSNLNSVTQDIFNKNYQAEELSHNYRSGKNIVDFNNHFFNLAAKSLEQKYQPIYATLNQENVNKDGYVELEIIPDDLVNKQEEMLSKILVRINTALTDGFQFSDICVITRNNKDGAKIATYLQENNIPVFSKESLFLKNSKKVNLIMNFIKYLTYPNDKSAGFKVIDLHQSIFHSSSASMALFEKFRIRSSIFDAKKYLETVNINFDKNRLLNQNSFQLVDEIIKLLFKDNSDVYLKFLAEYIFNQWQKQPMAIHELCLWWEEEKDKLCIQSSDDNNSVILTTIHKSKGLQFPIVIFPYASWKVSNSKNWLWVELNKDEYPIETFLVKSNSAKLDQTNFSDLKAEEKSKSSLDDLNLIYVAFTRPEERLYILSFDDVNYFKNIKPYLLEILNKKDEDGLVYCIGKPTPNQKKPKENQKLNIVQFSNEKKWDERLRLSISPNKNSDEKTEAYALKMVGIAMHSIFEKTKKVEDAILQLELLAKKDPIIQKNYNKIKSELESTYKNEIIFHLNENFSAINEATILDIDGESYRPDKIYLNGNKITILDYKTGGKKDDHKNQILKYSNLMEQIGFIVEKRYLYYTKANELQAI